MSPARAPAHPVRGTARNLLVVLLLLFLPSPSPADASAGGKAAFTILHTANGLGEISPCG